MSKVETPVKAVSAMEREAYSIPEFCLVHGFSEPAYYKLRKSGIAPAEMRINGMVRISKEAAADWRRARENPTGKEAQDVESKRLKRLMHSRKASTRSMESNNHISKRRKRGEI